jgi:hypothetical protein
MVWSELCKTDIVKLTFLEGTTVDETAALEAADEVAALEAADEAAELVAAELVAAEEAGALLQLTRGKAIAATLNKQNMLFLNFMNNFLLSLRN